MKTSVLIVDDQQSICVAIQRLLEERGFQTEICTDGSRAIELLDQGSYQLVLTDLSMGPVSGMDVLRAARPDDGNGRPAVVMMTAYGSERTAVEAMKLGAADYVPKPFDNDEILMVIDRALERHRLLEDNQLLRREVRDRYRFHNILGRSSAMQEVFARVERVASTDLTVLVQGPSGTGKELIARALHYNSPRRRRPLIAINCAAFSRELVESELFGHEQGAFTGATRSRQGKFELADGGSIFLDEIGDMPHETQAKVLRVLQERTFERVGGNRSVKVDVRVIAATNQDLEKKMETGEFRRDLYYRLNVVSVELPPLRERSEDINLLAEHFLERANKRQDGSPKKLSSAVLRRLNEHCWPGNVRELEHAIEHAVALAPNDEICLGDLPGTIRGGDRRTIELGSSQLFKEAKEAMIESFERQFIGAALRQTNGNVTHAAKKMGLYRQQLQQKLVKLDLDPKQYRS